MYGKITHLNIDVNKGVYFHWPRKSKINHIDLQGDFLNLAGFEIEKLGMKFSMKWGNNDSICLLFTRVSDFSIHAILGPETRIFGKSGKNYLNRPNHRNGFGSPSRAANAIKVFLEIAPPSQGGAPPSQGGAHEKI